VERLAAADIAAAGEGEGEDGAEEGQVHDRDVATESQPRGGQRRGVSDLACDRPDVGDLRDRLRRYLSGASGASETATRSRDNPEVYPAGQALRRRMSGSNAEEAFRRSFSSLIANAGVNLA
jgi:hypothetical protein